MLLRVKPDGRPNRQNTVRDLSGEDPGFEKGGGAVASGARSQDFFVQFRGLFKEFGARI